MALEREVGSTIASFRAEMAQFKNEEQQEFQNHKAGLDELTKEVGKLFAGNAEGLTAIAAKAEASFQHNNFKRQEIQTK